MKRILLLVLTVQCFIAAVAQVNPQTGSATFSLPMFNWADQHSRLNSVVSLDYNSGSGLKVNSTASNVGQGWNMIAGGVITRMQAGEPDDQKGRAGIIEDVNKYPNGYMYDPQTPEEGCPAALTRFPVFKDKNHLYKQHNTVAADKELDKFAFTFNGRTGIFILRKYAPNNDPKQYNKIVFLGDTRMKGWFVVDENWAESSKIRTTISEFYIQDENGLQYKFEQKERTKLLRVNYSSADLLTQLAQPKFKNNRVYFENSFDDYTSPLANPWVITSWYLSEIKDLLTNRTISFGYSLIADIDTYSGATAAYNMDKDYTMVTHRRSISRTPMLTSISYPDGHRVTFSYNQTNREDLKGDKAMTSVTVAYRPNTAISYRTVSMYKLKTAYLIQNRFGTPETDFQKRHARLYLLSVQKASVDLAAEEEPYLFDYYMGSSSPGDVVPAPFSPYKDIWDYYNGNMSQSAANSGNTSIDLTKHINQLTNIELKGLCFLRNNVAGINHAVNPGYAKNGLLKHISYPTGGTLEYEYEQNQFFDNSTGQHIDVGGVHVSAIKTADGGYSNNCDNRLVSNYKYETPRGSGPNPDLIVSSMWGYEVPDNSMQMSSHYEPEDKYLKYKFPLGLSCEYRYRYPGILSKDQAISVPWGIQALEILSSVMGIVSPVLEVIDIIKLIAEGTWVGVVVDLIGTIITLGITCLGSQSKDTNSTIYYNFDIHASNPLPMQFKRVVVRDGASGGVGATVMEFTSKDDYPLWAETNPSLSSKQRFAPWAYGLTKRSIVIDQNGNKVKEILNTYSFDLAKRTYDHDNQIAYWQTCKCLVTEMVSQRSDEWSDPAKFNPPAKPNLLASNSGVTVDIDYLYGGRVELTKTVERAYKQNSNTDYAETETNFRYHPVNYLLTTSWKKESDGKTSVRHVTYSRDYYYGPVFEDLQLANVVNMPITVSTGYVEPGVEFFPLMLNYNRVSETVTEFTKLPSGDIRLWRTLEQRFDLSSPGGGVTYGGPTNTNYSAYNVTKQITYDSDENTGTVKDEGNRSIANIYDHNGKFLIASVMNADLALDKPAYTSFETNYNYGGWTITGGSTSFSSTDAITGKRYFNMASFNTLTAPLNTSKSYRLSFWASSTSFNITGTFSLVNTGPTIGGFTLYEYILAAGPSGVTISGSVGIDELRLYPVNARMRTEAYDELLGKISESDENNRVVYYEYDDLARLRIIRDDRKNITKMYEYNVASRPVPCGGVYTHPAIKEVFTKNCGANFYSTEVVYTIPAGKYTSTVSQEEVYQAIENELKSAAVINYVNSNAQCLPLYGNDFQTAAFTKEGCDYGYIGSSVTYTVPQNKYKSKISVQDANEMAIEELEANGQANANLIGTCIVTTEPEWIGTGSDYCNNGHKYVQVKDMNPFSSTFGNTQYVIDPNDQTCPAPAGCHVYQVTVPYSVANDLYIEYGNCGENTQVVNWLLSATGYEVPDGRMATFCLSSPPAFRYGANGANVLIPQIEITIVGPCSP